jgi:hypothetical protein
MQRRYTPRIGGVHEVPIHNDDTTYQERIMHARLIGFWFIVECPKCARPVSVNRWVDGKKGIYDLLGTRKGTCDICETDFTFEVKSYEIEREAEGDQNAS